MFGVTRIPALPHDWNTEPNTKANHITVIARDNYYHLDVMRPSSTQPGRKEIVPLDEIERALEKIVEDARKGDGAGVGVMTSDHRDTWARVSRIMRIRHIRRPWKISRLAMPILCSFEKTL